MPITPYCGLWTRPNKRVRCRRGIIAKNPPRRAGPAEGVTTRGIKARLIDLARELDRLADAADSAA